MPRTAWTIFQRPVLVDDVQAAPSISNTRPNFRFLTLGPGAARPAFAEVSTDPTRGPSSAAAWPPRHPFGFACHVPTRRKPRAPAAWKPRPFHRRWTWAAEVGPLRRRARAGFRNGLVTGPAAADPAGEDTVWQPRSELFQPRRPRPGAVTLHSPPPAEEPHPPSPPARTAGRRAEPPGRYQPPGHGTAGEWGTDRCIGFAAPPGAYRAACAILYVTTGLSGTPGSSKGRESPSCQQPAAPARALHPAAVALLRLGGSGGRLPSRWPAAIAVHRAPPESCPGPCGCCSELGTRPPIGCAGARLRGRARPVPPGIRGKEKETVPSGRLQAWPPSGNAPSARSRAACSGPGTFFAAGASPATIGPWHGFCLLAAAHDRTSR